MPSTTSVLSTYTTFAASAMLLRSVLNEVQTMTSQLIPQKLQEKISSSLGHLFGSIYSQLALVINEYNGHSINEMYQASEVYLSTRITPSVGQLKVSKDPGDKSLSVTINKGQQSSGKTEHRSILLCFHKNNKEKVLNTFLPYVLERSKAIKNEKKVLKLQSLGNYRGVNLYHPSTFDTLARDPVLKKEIMDDLDRFVTRKDFYLKVGKPWKRGYLLYGPPGTGKSSLIAAMANYLKFDIYNLELASLHGNSDLRKLLTRTTNRSILVIKDIDCSIELQDRQNGGYNQGKSQILASNYLNVKEHSLFSEIDELIMEVEVTPAEVAEELMKNEDVDTTLTGLIGFLERKKKLSDIGQRPVQVIFPILSSHNGSTVSKSNRESSLIPKPSL
ncbi:hypothetical protein Peur_018763 [Populus x canadensis]